VTCEAIDGADRETVAAFLLLVLLDRTLAPTGTTVVDEQWRVAGVGFAPGSHVEALLDSSPMGSASASSSGVARDF
jgi:hypothetical protein